MLIVVLRKEHKLEELVNLRRRDYREGGIECKFLYISMQIGAWLTAITHRLN